LADARADLWKRQLSNAENYDKAVLSLSTAFLSVSLAFLKDLVPIHQAEYLGLLYASWWSLALSIILTIVSFLASQRAIEKQLKKAEDYYLDDDQSAHRKSRSAKVVDWINIATGMLFILGLLLMIGFVSWNLERSVNMSDEKKDQQVPLREGAMTLQMEQKGAPIPNLPRVPQGQPENKPPAHGTPAAPPGNNAPPDKSK
jgi:hypothetical protein